MSRITALWQDTPKPIRIVCYTLIPLGFLCGVAGVYGDGHNWWSNRGFLTNLMSSFTGLLFGVPVALTVISHLGNAQAEAIERRSVKRHASLAASDFQRMVISIFTASIRNSPEDALRALVDKARNLENQALELSSSIGPSGGMPRQMDRRRDAAQTIVASLAEFRASCKEVLDLWSEEMDESTWAGLVASQWKIFDAELRPRAREAGLPWLAHEKSFRIGNAVEVVRDASWLPVQEGLLEALREIECALEDVEWVVYREDFLPSAINVSEELQKSAKQARDWLLQLADLVKHLDDIRDIELAYKALDEKEHVSS